MALRFHAQTGGSTLTAQQPENNVVRVAIQAFAAVCGGTQSLHTNAFDEALALPTEHSAKLALRTQQMLAAEAGALDTADPLGGSYFIEALTDELEARAWELIERDRRARRSGRGDRAGLRAGRDRAVRVRMAAAGRARRARDRRRQPLHGGRAGAVELHRIDPDAERRQLERTARVRAERNADEASRGARRGARGGARRGEPPARPAGGAALPLHVGEICETLRAEWGMYDAVRSRA